MNFTTEIYRTDQNGNDADLELEVEITHYYRGKAGRYTGPWEDCYPDEDDELEFTAMLNGKDFTDSLTPKEYEAILDQALEVAEAYHNDF